MINCFYLIEMHPNSTALLKFVMALLDENQRNPKVPLCINKEDSGEHEIHSNYTSHQRDWLQSPAKNQKQKEKNLI